MKRLRQSAGTYTTGSLMEKDNPEKIFELLTIVAVCYYSTANLKTRRSSTTHYKQRDGKQIWLLDKNSTDDDDIHHGSANEKKLDRGKRSHGKRESHID